MTLACPEIHQRSVSGCGNITGIGSASGAWSGGADDSGASCARKIGAASKMRLVSTTAKLCLCCRPTRGMLIIRPQVPSGSTLALNGILRSRDYEKMNTFALRVLTELNPRTKLCLTSQRMSMTIREGGAAEQVAPSMPL